MLPIAVQWVCFAGVRRSPLQRDFPERSDKRTLKLAFHVQKDLISPFPRHRRLIGSLFDQGGEDVGNCQYPHDIRYAFGTKTIGIAASIKVFVMMANCIEYFRGRYHRPPSASHDPPSGEPRLMCARVRQAVLACPKWPMEFSPCRCRGT